MKSVDRISEIFGDDVQHLHGNLFRAKRSKIRLAKPGLSVDDGKLVYGNPRWFVNKDGNPEAKGVEKGKMEELSNSIQDEGLENPIRLRVKENGKKSHLEVVNGERRFRCLDDLCEKNVPCFHPETGEQTPAGELYEWVDCRIEFMDDEMALRCALKPNETSEIIGDLASINVVKTLRQSGFDDQEILKATGKSISWLRETEKIIGLDDVCLGHFENEKINRQVALHLASIKDAEERIALLEKINESAMARHAEKVAQVDRKISNSSIEQECQETAAHLAEKEGDDDAAEEHKEKAAKAKKRAEDGVKERKKLSQKGSAATSKDVENVTKTAKPLSHNKIQSVYMDLIEQIIAGEGLDENGDSLGINLEMLAAVSGVLSAIMEGNREAMEVLTEHCPLVMDDEEFSEIADESDDVDPDDDSDDDSDDDDDDEYEGDDESRVDDSYEPSEDDEKEFQGVRDIVEEDYDD
jgi:hypothetical protein